MNQTRHRLRRRVALAALLLSILAMVPTPRAFSQEPADTPSGLFQQQAAHRKPIPRGLKIAVLAGAVVLGAVALAFSIRAWHASNLFDREYRFPPVASVAMRLGANKSGGFMATIRFRDRGDPNP